MDEIPSGNDIARTPSFDQARGSVCAEMQAERADCAVDVQSEWPDIPAPVFEHLMQMHGLEDRIGALNKLQAQFSSRPSLASLSLQQLQPLFHRLAFAESESAETITNAGKRAIIRYQTGLSGQFRGAHLVDAVHAKIVADPDLTLEERQSALAKLDAVANFIARTKAIVADPQEQDALSRIILSVSIDLSADAPLKSFSGLEGAVATSADLSAPTKRRLQTLFASEPIKRGSQLRDALAHGRGETTLPNGEIRNLTFSEDNALPLSRDSDIYPDRGRFVIRSAMPDGRTLRFVAGSDAASGEDIGRKVNQALALSVISQNGILNLHGRGFGASQGSELIDLDATISDRASLFVDRLLRHCVGSSRGVDGDILSMEAIQELATVCHWLKPEHDALGGNGASGVNEYTSVDPHLVALGLLNEDGSVESEEAFQRVSAVVNTGLGNGMPDYERLLETLSA